MGKHEAMPAFRPPDPPSPSDPIPVASASDRVERPSADPRQTAHISVSDGFAENLGEAGLTAYVHAVVSAAGVAARGGDVAAVRRRLVEAFRDAAIPRPAARDDLIAEQLVAARGDVHVTALGRVIYGAPELDPENYQPRVVGIRDTSPKDQ